MAAIKVHGYHASMATVMVLCCLNEKEVEYELVLVDLPTGAHKKPEYLALNSQEPSSGIWPKSSRGRAQISWEARCLRKPWFISGVRWKDSRSIPLL